MFVWYETKRQKVIDEHKVDFTLLVDVFDDAFAYDFEDVEHSDEREIRYGVVGQTTLYGLILLIYTIEENGDVRFITARKAEKWLVKKYEENRR